MQLDCCPNGIFGGPRLSKPTKVGIEISINAVRVERGPPGIALALRMPTDRAGRLVVDLPKEVTEALGDVVLAAGLEQGVLREKNH
jgi:hypothetical protein